MALGQPLGLAALNSEGLRMNQVLRVPVRPVRHQLNSLCNRGGTLLRNELNIHFNTVSVFTIPVDKSRPDLTPPK